MIRISFDQARAIAIQSAILYHTRTAKQILVEGTLEGINEAKYMYTTSTNVAI